MFCFYQVKNINLYCENVVFFEKCELDGDVYTISFMCLECNNILPEMVNDVVQETPAPASPVLFKGMFSIMAICSIMFYFIPLGYYSNQIFFS